MAVRKPEDCAIFRDHCIDKMKVSGNLLELGENPPCHDHNRDSESAYFRDSSPDLGIQDPIASDRSIIVQCQHAEFHDRLPVWISALRILMLPLIQALERQFKSNHTLDRDMPRLSE